MAAQQLRDKDEPFAFATIVRTAGSTAAKPGAKALLSADGTILQGWLGGGCTRGAVKARNPCRLSCVTANRNLCQSRLKTFWLKRAYHRWRLLSTVRSLPAMAALLAGQSTYSSSPVCPHRGLWFSVRHPSHKALSAFAPQFHWSVAATSRAEEASSTAICRRCHPRAGRP